VFLVIALLWILFDRVYPEVNYVAAGTSDPRIAH
jgi:hypothetical protein